jgi:hypothetical protein
MTSVVAREDQRFDREVECPAGFEIDNQFKLCAVLNRKIGGISAFPA